MIPIIGLIVAVYAVVRLLQAPIEMSAGKEDWFGTPFQARFLVLTGLSVMGMMAILFLSLLLLVSNTSI